MRTQAEGNSCTSRSWLSGRRVLLAVTALVAFWSLWTGACSEPPDRPASPAAGADGLAAERSVNNPSAAGDAPSLGSGSATAGGSAPSMAAASSGATAAGGAPEVVGLMQAHSPGAARVTLEPGERQAMILYSGAMHGQIEACGCGGNPVGGLSKETTVVTRLRQRGLPTLHVSPGDLFPFEKRPAKMKYIAESAALMGYDAIAVGDQELIEGLPRFRELVSQYKLPYISENMLDPQGKRLAPGYVIKELAGIKVGIFAVMGDERYLYFQEDFMKEVTIGSPVAAAEAVLAELHGKVDFIVCLSHQDKYLDRRLAARFPQINVIVGGHDEELLLTPLRIGHTVIVNAGVAGENVGVLRLAVNPQRAVRIIGYEFGSASVGVPKDERVEQIYQRYLKDAKPKDEEENLEPLPEVYQSSETCEPCHKAIYQEWRTTKHAKAWQTLIDAGRTEDRDCWYCHSMGFDRKSGFRSAKETPELANVSCQACHLVTHDHHDRSIKDNLEDANDQKTCVRCHTPVQSRDFNFWERVEKIDHHDVKEKSNDPPAGYKSWRVVPVHIKKKVDKDKEKEKAADSVPRKGDAR